MSVFRACCAAVGLATACVFLTGGQGEVIATTQDDQGIDELAVLSSLPINPDHAEEGQRLIEEKMELVAQANAASSASPLTDKPDESTSSFEDAPWYERGRSEELAGVAERGIIDDREAPAPAAEFLAANRWNGSFLGQDVLVYAGSAGFDKPDTGAVMIFFEGAFDQGVLGERLLLQGSGELRVTSVYNGLVQLAGADGATHELVLASRTLR